MLRADLEPAARNWQLWTSAAFLREYLDAVDPQLIPSSREDLAVLLDVFLLEKAVYQLGTSCALAHLGSGSLCGVSGICSPRPTPHATGSTREV